ncbi:MAG: TlpA disulfide reductase family protein [Dehalococcoidia bacterium]|nr:TlpA family protein disulfide reductase [Dehalococcoidia bacterium]MCB9486458.1 TlpA family protein disulfide reductase [Thermoflexaceae bacterium]
MSEPGVETPDERPHRRREYSGPGSTLGLAALVVIVVAGLIWWFEFRGNGDLAGSRAHGLGVVGLPQELNPTGRVPVAEEGRAAPDFRLASLDGEPVQLTQFRGKYVLVNFWASWCGPCRGETPELVALSQRTEGQGLVVIGVNQQEGHNTAASFANEFAVTYPVLLDPDGEVSVAYRVGSGLPITMLIDPTGVVRHVYIGQLDAADLAQIEEEAT